MKSQLINPLRNYHFIPYNNSSSALKIAMKTLQSELTDLLKQEEESKKELLEIKV
ncbi:hypothetical protein HNP77_002391 [Treponema rectale]|uniref:Uncharacterized protein n=1 Tax=Treponema rectale TaxID=744512 RepID=A0A840SKW7_9SPIR|nr:hypothetical protein [Treponema rectale]MBB5220001.1 hypothetical protein [Treponema rectale]